MPNNKRGFVLLVGILFLAACAAPTTQLEPTLMPSPAGGDNTAPALPTATTEPLAALVNGEPITMAEYERQVASYEATMGLDPSAASPEDQETELAAARAYVLETLIDQVLITQAAVEMGITVTDEEVEAEIQSLIADLGQEVFEQRLAEEGLTLDEARTRLKQDMLASRVANQIANNVPIRAEHVNARHIVVRTEEEGRQLLNQIMAGADFAALAQAYSQDAFTRDRGGDLGYFPKGILTSPEVENAAFNLQPGQVSDLIQSNQGYHIVQVVDRVADMEINAVNLKLLKDNALDQWLKSIEAQADVERFVSATP